MNSHYNTSDASNMQPTNTAGAAGVCSCTVGVVDLVDRGRFGNPISNPTSNPTGKLPRQGSSGGPRP